MSGKSSVSTLQEYCAKENIPAPNYIFMQEDGAFVCQVEVNNLTETGMGRSKRDAKHVAAANAIKKLGLVTDELEFNAHGGDKADESLAVDMIITLRDFCVRNYHPLPEITIVQQSGTPDAPVFTAVCKVASVECFAISEQKTDAKQKAAKEMLRLINKRSGATHEELEVLTLNSSSVEDVEEERYEKFNSYRKLKDKGVDYQGMKMSDRHNFFTKFHQSLKDAAAKVIAASYESKKSQAMDLLEALKLKPCVKVVKSLVGPKLQITLDCDYDAVFIGFEEVVYNDVIEYFNVMLDLNIAI